MGWPMPPAITYQRLAGHARFDVKGVATIDDMITLVGVLAERTRQEGDTRVLVDLRGVENVLKFTDHFQLGEEVARKLRHLEKVASVVPPDRITRTSEKVAARQGFPLHVFTDIDEASAWLAQP
jgi:hypothetical protein